MENWIALNFILKIHLYQPAILRCWGIQRMTMRWPATFDPFTVGHESVVRRALKMFDKIIIAIGFNTTKTAYFPLDKRIAWIKKVFADTDRVEVYSFKGLTVDYCKSVGAKYILRGLRTAADFEYERAIAQVNKAMYNEVATV